MTPKPLLPAVERFWSRVEFTDSCWCWTGEHSDRGYGRFWDGARRVRAHRWAYEFCVGPIPAGLTIDHLCRVHACVNPDHLEAVTNRVNILRGIGLTAQHARKTHCPHGHPYSGSNLIVPPRGGRECRACKIDRNTARRLANTAQGGGA